MEAILRDLAKAIRLKDWGGAGMQLDLLIRDWSDCELSELGESTVAEAIAAGRADADAVIRRGNPAQLVAMGEAA